ncbi:MULTISPECIES: alcohol dehydrogenase catalytic domain-containing protein [unclassified Vibrio]|uniref:alcohol dehydrogenase catalytic domain-containing protein n=1 Tax=unclassified Vibrio TaxID=2614977 RepID=UPI003550A81E
MAEINYAWTFNAETKEPEDLELRELELPKLSKEEILIKNLAIALNPVDWKVIHPGMVSQDGYQVAGVDGCGVVVAKGPNANVNIGDHVAYHQSLARHGSYAHYSVVDSSVVFKVDPELDKTIAAALMCTGLTAWQAIEKLPLAKNARFIVNGAGGLVGRLIVELALSRGYDVITISSASHHDSLIQSGVSAVFDYNDENWNNALVEYLGNERAFIAVDTVNKESAEAMYPFLDVNSHLIVIQDRIASNPFPGFDKAISIHEVALNAFHKYPSKRELKSLRVGFEYLCKNCSHIVSGRLDKINFQDIPKSLAKLKAGYRGKLVAQIE